MKKVILRILLILNIAFIFFMSSRGQGESSLVSNSFLMNTLGSLVDGKLLDFLLNYFTYDAIHHFIRKLAHFSEYFSLGLLTYLNLKETKINPLYSLVTSYIIATYDELFQGIFDRTTSIYDTFIDFSGSLSGIIFIIIIIYIIKKASNKKLKAI